MRSENRGLEPQKRFASQQGQVVTIFGLLKELAEGKISAERVSALFSEDERLPLHEAVEALEALQAPPSIARRLKEHPALDVLAAVDAARNLGLFAPLTSDLADIPSEILWGYAVDWERMEPIVDRIGRIPDDEAQELALSLFNFRGPDVAISLSVLEDSRFLRGYYTFAWMMRWHSDVLRKALGEIFFSDVEPFSEDESYPFILCSSVSNDRIMCVQPNPRVVAHGKFEDKNSWYDTYWVFFLMM